MPRFTSSTVFASLVLLAGQSFAGQYDQLGTYSGQLRECYENNLVSPQFNSDTQRAMSTIAALAKLDLVRFQNQENDAYNTAAAGMAMCRDVESTGYTIQAHARQMVANNNEGVARQQAQVQQYWPQPVRQPIFCNRVGTTTMCN